ncbi:MAG TPA: PepSY-associated TM helix domain-containing protein [Candidatus Limnocylindria bacterium]|jgi:hypothetical protein|nr:PepSY-associated TM helix domain-containing protein [Candidatus Limnocylindria bacterium]
MKRRFYWVIRDLHLYLGLFSSPFVLVFAVSVFFLVHAWLPQLGATAPTNRVVSVLPLPTGLQTLSGTNLIEALKPILLKAGVPGEIGYVRHQVKEDELLIPVAIPGRDTTVTLSLVRGEASIVTREGGLAAALVALHKTPGPHRGEIQMNWIYMKAWRWLSDATAYLVLFVSLSGVYLWYVLRAERKAGFILLGAGAVSFLGLAYALSH